MPSRKAGCVPCRDRHLKCDRARPVCSSCKRARASLRCEYASKVVQIRESNYSSRVAELSARTKQRRKDSDSTTSLLSPIEGASPDSPVSSQARNDLMKYNQIGHDASDELECSAATSRDFQQPNWKDFQTAPNAVRYRSPKWVGQDTHARLERAAWQYSMDASSGLSDGQSMSADRVPGFSSPPPPVYSTTAVVTNRLDAKVFAFYVKQAGPWLDIASSDRHFGEKVPKLALVTPVLFYACLAYASRVLVLMGELDRPEGDRYHDQAITTLIPLLSAESDALKNEALLATVVILRMSEQFCEVQNDMQCHLLGATSLFARSNRWSLEEQSLEVASFWVYIRQNIRMCFLNEQPCQFDLDASPLSMSYSAAPETVWTNRITYLTARICNECWKDPTGKGGTACSRGSWDNYEHLQSSIERWRQSLPDSFQPWCHIQDEFEAFPVVRYVSICHAVAWQYYNVCRVMLALYGRGQTACSALLEINQYMESEVLAPARLVCGITFSCDDVGAVINGSHLAAWCGQLFSGKEEQRRLLNFLQNFMHQTKWPNETCCDRLQRIWSGTNQP